MALQVWLPLDKNLNNQGLSNISINNTGTTIDNNGKIGKCFKITSAKSLGYTPNFNNKGLSLCGWFKFNQSEINSITSTQTYDSTYNSCTGNLIGNNSYGGIGLIWQTNNIYSSGSLTSITIKSILRTSAAGSKSTSGFNIEFDKWIHIVLTWDPNTHVLSLYKDGILFNSVSNIAAFTDGASRVLSISHQGVWGGNARTPVIPIYENDIRVYDHCLSPKEVHEISKGLVLHYKLDANGDGNIGNTNLVKNGWGGTENWNNSNYSTTELPSVTGITHSYYNCSTKEFIPIISNHTYELSCYIKTKTGTGTCYVAFIPYDIDKNQISYYNMKDGFRASSLTTLAQDLKTGDTIIYLTNASGWANPGTYQYRVAIFGYCDSTGYKYPDLVYTRRIYAFGTTSDKSHLDVANNTVTLNAAYSGKTIPKGTSICLTGDGGTYYYPITVGASGATDWVLKSVNIIPQNINYLKAAKYIKVSSISGYQYLAGITLKDNTASNLIYDCSGYIHHGNIVGQITSESNTPRYNYCLKNSSEYPCKTSTAIYFPESSGLTICCWMNLTVWGSQISGIWATSNSATSPSDYNTTACNHRDSGFDMRGTNGTTYRLTCNSTDIPLNTWKHVAMTHDGANAKLYINGSLVRTLALPSPLVAFNYVFLGYSLAGGAVRKCQGSWSDFRIYATALSADDIKELYDTPTFIDNQGDLLSEEFDELSNNMLTLENNGITTKKWLGGLSRYTQANCQCTLEDDGYKIYRPANQNNSSNGGSNNMWGGFVLDNTNNRYGFVDGHTYIIEFDIKGQSSAAASDVSWNNMVGWSGGGLIPAPTNVVNSNPVTANFDSQEWHHFYYKWTISDGVYKVCTSAYSSYVQGNTYLSYKEFKYGFGYTNTGTLGTELYIRNLRMYDITTNKEINIKKTGITEAINFVEEGNETQFFKTNIINSTQILEI